MTKEELKKEAEESGDKWIKWAIDQMSLTFWNSYVEGYLAGAEFVYNKANEEVKHDLMMKLKDEGIVKPLKDSILRNEQLSSQEQQELCAWVECAIDFGENLDECAKELEEANKANEWHYVKDGNLPKVNELVLIKITGCFVLGWTNGTNWFNDSNNGTTIDRRMVYAWKEIVLPKESE